MADKKPASKGAPKLAPSSGGGEGQMIFMALVAAVVLFVIIPTTLKFFGFSGDLSVPDNAGEQVSSAFDSFVTTVSFISIFISFVIVLLIFYAKVQYKEITTSYGDILKKKDDLQERVSGTGVSLPVSQASPQFTPTVSEPDPRWLEIQKHIESYNQSDWRVAILEADILLYDMLNQMGYQGDSIGTMLKQVDRSSFITLDDAWKAHKIRNTIAHEGAGYELTRDEAERAIRLYQRVFEEFYFI
jgi:hypothetical protein